MTRRWSLAIVLLAFVAALAGGTLGRALVKPEPAAVGALHHLLYDELDLTARQRTRLKQLEREYMADKARLEGAMRTNNRRLADAIQREHGYGPGVSGAVDRSHQSMGDLQKLTLAHVFAMRTVLTPDQAVRYDRVVTKTLTDPAR